MLNLPLLPISQPVASHAKTAINSATPVSPIAEQPRDRAFSNVLKNSEQETLAAEQDGISTESVTPDDSPVESLVESPVIASGSVTTVLPAGIISDPETRLTPGTVSTMQLATGNPTVRLTGNSPITGQSGFFATDHLSNRDALLPQRMSNPINFATSKLTQSAFAGAGTLNLPSGTIEPLSYINAATDGTAILADGGKYLPLSTSSIHSSPATTTSVPVSAALGDSVWPEEFGQKITWLATQRLQTAELKLNPAHLGPIEVSLKITSEQGVQQLTAQFMSHNPQVREAIEANLPRLREIMAESGITLTDTSVGADTSRQDAQNRQQAPAYSHSPSSENANNTNIRHGSGQTAINQVNLINTFA